MALTISQDIHFLQQTLALAQKAAAENEVPVGAIIVGPDGEILAQAWNRPIQDSDPSAHAEILAIRQAGEVLNNYRLIGCTLYVSLEPCSMCVGAIIHARIKRVVFAASDAKTGAVISQFGLLQHPAHNHFVEYSAGLLADEASAQLSQFFQRRRREKKAAKQGLIKLK